MMTRGKGKGKAREVIDLTGDDSFSLPDDDIFVLDTPPAHMKKWNNANRPIDVDGDDAAILQRYTPEENELRRMLMMDHDLMGEERKKRQGGDVEGSQRKRAPVEPVEQMAGPSNLTGEVATAEPTPSTTAPIVTVPEPPIIDALVAQILAIVPDMCPLYATKELEILIAAGQTDTAVGTVLANAFDKGYTRPAIQVAEPGADEQYLGKVFRAEKRRGDWYQMKSITALEEAFPAMPVGHIRDAQNRSSFLFGPTYLLLLEHDRAPVKPYTPLKRGRLASKGKTAMPEHDEGSIEFELEKNWILAHVATIRAAEDARVAQELADQAELDAGNGVECGCCFGEYVPGNMFTCPDGHLFCKDCCTRHVETELGDEIHVILCMDTSGCESRFTDKELARLLPPKSLDLLQRLQLAEELEKADIEGLETCPSCPWAVVIDNPEEKLFRCESCTRVSCRQCKKQEHLPKSCQEFAAEAKADKRHAVEDAMSEALIRKCPQCQKPYIKESGCNKIRCMKCQVISCYICQQLITGYDHFDTVGLAGGQKCVLWDREEAKRDVENVIRARDAAVLVQQQVAAQEGVDINAADLAVEAPRAPPPDPRFLHIGIPQAPRAPRVLPPRVFPAMDHPPHLAHHGDRARDIDARLLQLQAGLRERLERLNPGDQPDGLPGDLGARLLRLEARALERLNRGVQPDGLPGDLGARLQLQARNLERLNPGVQPDLRRLQQEEERRNRLYHDRLRAVREEENARFMRVQEERRARRIQREGEWMDVDRV